MTFHIPQAYIYLLTTYKRQPIQALKAIIHNNNTFAMATAEGAKRCSQRPHSGILWAGWLLLPASKLWSTPAESISPESGHAVVTSQSTGFNRDVFNLPLNPPGCWWWQHRGVTTSGQRMLWEHCAGDTWFSCQTLPLCHVLTTGNIHGFFTENKDFAIDTI